MEDAAHFAARFSQTCPRVDPPRYIIVLKVKAHIRLAKKKKKKKRLKDLSLFGISTRVNASWKTLVQG